MKIPHFVLRFIFPNPKNNTCVRVVMPHTLAERLNQKIFIKMKKCLPKNALFSSPPPESCAYMHLRFFMKNLVIILFV